MAKEDETALLMLTTEQKNELAQQKRQITEMKKGMPALGTLAVGGVSALTGAVIGGAEGMRTGGDATAEKAIRHFGAGIAAVVGVGGVIGFGKGAPKLQAASAGVAIAGATILAYNAAKDEGIAMNLAAAAAKAKAAAAPQVSGGYRR